MPDVLTVKETELLLNTIRKPCYRVFLFTVYSMGLRLGEGLKLEVGDIIKKHYDAFKSKYRKRLLPGHLKAINSISRCRTPESGEMVLKCPKCSKTEYLPHSCGHRNCPQCQNHETTEWLERQRKKLLPVPYFLVTFTVPSILRPVAWKSQKIFFDAMFKASSATLNELAKNERFLGGKIGTTGVLHTHNRRLDFHPHIHYDQQVVMTRESIYYGYLNLF
ncbi:MAG: transposase zinc-binding domain-containing protein [Candidatus Riflebacteria bacterium]|nr:transposase zinc-binding domain-containing protein [Candidatus Riflebacteria bacterium]